MPMKCVGCDCTNERACPGGCNWASTNPPLCSACVDRELLANAGPIDADAAGDDPCIGSPIGAHELLWLNARSGYCTHCRESFVASEAA